ncbi:MAG: Gfo/Idh/MocA family oxidoreductase, partial [Thermoguttaceae bacterium]|nr:Gfo/Idh/MocA family oxidoreductase [Thermoguttaceae bacterium]
MQRRNFLKYAGLGSAAIAAGPAVFGDEPSSEKLYRVGLIGAGWYGKMDLFRLIQVANVEVVSVCDVDQEALDEAARMIAARQKSGKEPEKFHDYREMIAKNNLDIVLIDTPDHWHALPMIAAVEAGIDVYVQ